MAQGEEGVPHSRMTKESSITGDDWKRSLAAARVRRKGTDKRLAESAERYRAKSAKK